MEQTLKYSQNGSGFRFYNKDSELKLPSQSIPLVVGIDPSKSGCAIAIGTIMRDEPVVTEVSGTGMDTTVFCEALKDILARLFDGCTIHTVYIERMILPSNKRRGEEGTHRSFITVEILSEIQAALKSFFYVKTGFVPELINNQLWKSAIIPPEFNRKNTKGSISFLYSENRRYVGYSDNATDAVCIYRYATHNLPNNLLHLCCKVPDHVPYHLYICTREIIPQRVKPFRYAHAFTIEQNLQSWAENFEDMGVTAIPRDSLDEGVISYYAVTDIPDSEHSLYLLVKRQQTTEE